MPQKKDELEESGETDPPGGSDTVSAGVASERNLKEVLETGR